MDKKELEETLSMTRRALMEIEDEERKAENQKYVGKFFKFRNCYSCPEENGYWWLYIAITGMDEFGTLMAWNFQTDIYGKSEIEKETVFYNSKDHIEISEIEFREAYSVFVKELNKLIK